MPIAGIPRRRRRQLSAQPDIPQHDRPELADDIMFDDAKDLRASKHPDLAPTPEAFESDDDVNEAAMASSDDADHDEEEEEDEDVSEGKIAALEAEIATTELAIAEAEAAFARSHDVPIPLQPPITDEDQSDQMREDPQHASPDSTEEDKPEDDDMILARMCPIVRRGVIADAMIVELDFDGVISACMLSKSSSATVYRIAISFVENLPPLDQRAMVVTSEPLRVSEFIDLRTYEPVPVRGCDALCDSLPAYYDCECVDGLVDDRMGAHVLCFVMRPKLSEIEIMEGMDAKVLSLLTDSDEVEQIQIAAFDSVVASSKQMKVAPSLAKVDPWSFVATPFEVSHHLLSLCGCQRLQQLTLKVETTQESQRSVRLQAIPLIADDELLKEHLTRTCVVTAEAACSVMVEPLYDYDVRILNDDAMSETVFLFHEDFDEVQRDIHDHSSTDALFLFSVVVIPTIVCCCLGIFKWLSSNTRYRSVSNADDDEALLQA